MTGSNQAILPVLLDESGAKAHSPLEAEVSALFEQLRQPLFRYLLSIGLASQDGEEVIQEVFLALFRHLQQGKPRANLRGWVFRVGHNLGLKRRLENVRHSSEEAPEPADAAPDPEVQAMNGERHARLSAVWGVLPEQDRRCLALRAEGLRYREIAEILDMSLGSVSMSLTRSLQRMARAANR